MERGTRARRRCTPGWCSPLPPRHGLGAAWVRTPDHDHGRPRPWSTMGDWLRGTSPEGVDVDGMLAARGRVHGPLLARLAELGIDDVDVLLLQRASTLRHHPGQVAFPGGARDPDQLPDCRRLLLTRRCPFGLPKVFNWLFQLCLFPCFDSPFLKIVPRIVVSKGLTGSLKLRH